MVVVGEEEVKILLAWDAILKDGRYIFASINYRLLDEANILEMIYDCKAAIRYLKSNAKKYGIDKNKIGVWGTSAGGHLSCNDWTHLLHHRHLEGDIENTKKMCCNLCSKCFGPQIL